MIEFLIRETFSYFFVRMENESKCKWRTLKIINASFLNVIANLFEIIIFRFILFRKLFWQKRFIYFINMMKWK